jgi:hypothetical protein
MNIQNRITQTIMEFPARYSNANNTRTKWLEPVIGFADTEDPLFEALKTIVSPTHALPDEIVPGAKSVVAYFMPFERYVNESNIPEEESSIEWDYAYIETNQMLVCYVNRISRKKSSGFPGFYQNPSREKSRLGLGCLTH